MQLVASFAAQRLVQPCRSPTAQGDASDPADAEADAAGPSGDADVTAPVAAGSGAAGACVLAPQARIPDATRAHHATITARDEGAPPSPGPPPLSVMSRE